jgi:hypothetical protein
MHHAYPLGIKEDALGQRGLPRIDVGAYSYVSDALQVRDQNPPSFLSTKMSPKQYQMNQAHPN